MRIIVGIVVALWLIWMIFTTRYMRYRSVLFVYDCLMQLVCRMIDMCCDLLLYCGQSTLR